MIVALDCDGVLADFNSAARELAPHPDAPTLEKAFGFDGAMWDAIARRDIYFHLAMRVLPGAVKSVYDLRHFGHKVICVTAPPKREMPWHHWRATWLQRNFGFHHDDVIFARDKSLIRADVLVDDFAKNLRTFPGRRIMVTQPWNVPEDVPECTRIASVADLPEVL
jgi:5'(3')-deoxyribonucleotidase